MQKNWQAAILAVLAATGGCAAATTQSPPQETLDVRRVMLEDVNPAALAIWDVGNNAVGDDGTPQPSSIDADAVRRLHDAATDLAVTANRMVTSPVIRASGPDLVGGKVPEGVASREQIQAAIDANPAGFRAYATVVRAEAQAIVAAADAGDKVHLAELVARFDGACQSCHEKYWYVAQ